jgi:glycosyltransferase involved in cell wall biosynthesis
VRDLLVTTHTPVLRSGQAMRTYAVARALAEHRGLDLLFVRFGAVEPDEAFRTIAGVQLCEVLPSRGLRRLLAYAGARLDGVPKGFARGVSRELAERAGALADDAGRGRVIADGPIAAAALARLARQRPVIYNAHNLESSFRHQLSGGTRARKAMRAFERGLLERASESWMVSEPDLQAAHELCPDARLRYAPNAIDVGAIAPVTPLTGARNAIFVASFAYAPNLDGLRFLLDEVFPLVWTQLPDARLTLVGAGLAQPPSSDPRVQALGFVEDLHSAYAQASCAVVPLMQGGGSPLKLIEALAHGLPVIATRQAASRLHLRDGEHCLIADGGEQFAAALVRVLREGGGELGSRGRALARERYSIEALAQLLAV